MIKRPFLWGIVAFVGGILFALKKIPLPFLLIPSLLIWLFTYLLIYRFKKYLNRKDSFLWILPLLMLLGFLVMKDQMKPPDMDTAFEDKASCILTGKINSIAKREKGCIYYLKDNRITLSDDKTYPVENIIVYAKDHDDFKIGNLVTVSGTVYKFSPNSNPGGFNEYLHYKIQNISYKVYSENISLTDSSYSIFRSALHNLKERLINTYIKILPDKEAGVLTAMILGEKYLLDDEIKNLYQENGISHILAISGLHISMLGAVIYYFLRKLKLGLYISSAVSLMFIYCYGILTNFSVSTNRALVMYIIMLFANLIGKTYDLLSALSLSAFIILLQNPMQLFHAGFLLSYGAILGIALIVPCLNKLFEAKNAILSGIYVSAGAQIFTLPLVLYYFFQLASYGVIINMLVVPLSSLLMVSALCSGIFGMISLPIGKFLAGGANYILIFYEVLCRLGTNLPLSLITAGRPERLRIVIYYLLIFIFIAGVQKYGKKKLLIILALAIVVLIYPKNREGLTVAVLDVGQGDAIFMETENGTTFLIDGGSMDVENVGIYRIRPYLLSRGIDRIDYAIVTHADTDHISGIMELIKDNKITVSNLVLPKTVLIKYGYENGEIDMAVMAKSDTYSRLENLAERYNVKTMYIKAGDYIKEGKLEIICLNPVEGYNYFSENAASTVLSVTYGNFDMLLTGDLEAEGEELIISMLGKNRLNKEKRMTYNYDVLKVAHHGSGYSTSKEFLEIVKPRFSLISCGKNNRYGHPHKELLERLDEIGSNYFITYEAGAITICTDGDRMVLYEYLDK